ncbi:MAG: hypothetical protein ACYTEQ_21855, partial [Planctomycetota bacterium]
AYALTSSDGIPTEVSSTDIDNIVAAIDANSAPILCSTTVTNSGHTPTTTAIKIANGWSVANAFSPGTLVIVIDADGPTDADGNRLAAARRIKSYSAGDVITFNSSDKPLPFTPANGDTVKIYANIATTRKGGV